MKKFRRIVKYLLLSAMALFIVLTVVAKLSENAITGFVTDKISQSIDAPIHIEDASFTLIRRFPLATIEFKGISLGTPFSVSDSLAETNAKDTLASIGHLYISVKSKELFAKKLEIIKIEIDGIHLNYLVDSAGNSNFDFLSDTTATAPKDTAEAKPFNLALNQFLLKDVSGIYIDKKLNASGQVHVPEIKISGDIIENNYDARIKGSLHLSNCVFQETPINKMQSAELELDLDYLHDTVFIHAIELHTEGAGLQVSGNVYLKDKMPGELTIKGSELNLNELKKYFPDNLLEENGIKQLDGILAFNASVFGALADSVLPKVSADFNLNKGRVRYLDYPLLKNLALKGNATNGFLKNNKTTQATIENFHFETAKSSGDISASVQNLDQLKYKVKCKLNLQLDEFNEFIPDSIMESMDGTILFDLNTEGELPQIIDSTFTDYLLANTNCNVQVVNVNVLQSPELRIDSLYSVIQYKPYKISMQDLKLAVPNYHLHIFKSSLFANFSGSIADPETLQLNLESLNIRTPQSFFRTSVSVKNLNAPSYTLSTHLGFSLQEWMPIMPDSIINNAKGNVLVDIYSNGMLNLDSIAAQAIPIVFNSSSATIGFDAISLDMADTIMNVEDVSGDISLSEGKINISKLKGTYMHLPWGVDSTTIENIYTAYFQQNGDTIKVDTRLQFGDVNYAVFAPMFASDTVSADTVDTVSAPKEEKSDFKFAVKGKIHINSVTYEKAFLKNISGKYKLKNDLYIVDQLKFEGFDGSINSSVRYSTDENKVSTLHMRNNIDSMNVKNLLCDFDNFDQTNITDKNISGLITSELHSQIKMIGDSVIKDAIRLKGAFTIENGGIYDYAPLRELPRITSLDELEKIEFKTLDTKVFIIQSGVYVPETYISSSAFDLSAFGMQMLNDDYEYHLRLHLKDFLLGKSKKLLKEQAKYGDDAGKDKRNSMDIFSAYKDGKPSNGFDNDNSRKRMEIKIRTQESILKLKFHEKVVNYNTGVK